MIGPNGAGKSTLIRILMGLIHQDCGGVRVFGKNMPDAHIDVKKDIAYASHDMRLYKGATLSWHMNLIASFYPVWQTDYANDLIDRFNLDPNQKAEEMSLGQRVKSLLLLAFARRSKLLILDEPTTGLDPLARQETLGAMTDVLKDEQRTILFSSHNTGDVEQLSDTITFINNGQIITSQNKESFLDSWRRIRVRLPENGNLPALEGIKQVQTSGRLAVVTTDQFTDAFSDQINHHFRDTGISIDAVEHMTLEEIFIVEAGSNQEGARV